MRIDTVTKFRCDGCGTETTQTHGWMSMIPLISGGMTTVLNTGGTLGGRDYCATCVSKMQTYQGARQ